MIQHLIGNSDPNLKESEPTPTEVEDKVTYAGDDENDTVLLDQIATATPVDDAGALLDTPTVGASGVATVGAGGAPTVVVVVGLP